MWRGGSLRVPVPDVGSSVLGFMQTFMHRDWSRPAQKGGDMVAARSESSSSTGSLIL